MSDPWDIMNDWIRERIINVAKGHNWTTDTGCDLYKWVFAIYNHRHVHGTRHFEEPPIPVVIGYLGQIASLASNASDPSNANGKQESELLGNAAISMYHHPSVDLHSLNSPGNEVPPDPAAELAKWICDRIEYAAEKAPTKEWPQQLEPWLVCVANASDSKAEKPTSLAVGYIVQVACNHQDPIPSSGDDGATISRIIGETIAALDNRPLGGWHKCDLDFKDDELGKFLQKYDQYKSSS